MLDLNVLLNQADEVHWQINQYLMAGFIHRAELERQKLIPIEAQLVELQEQYNEEESFFDEARAMVIALS